MLGLGSGLGLEIVHGMCESLPDRQNKGVMGKGKVGNVECRILPGQYSAFLT